MNESLSIVKSSFIKSPHAFSTRLGGVSQGIFSSLNLGMNRGDDIASVKENWNRFLKASNINTNLFVCGKQVHSNYVHIATSDDLREAYGPGDLIEADGYVTNESNVAIAVFTADCVPVLLEDIDHHVIGSVHCGWRSTMADIENNTIDKMLSLGAHPENIRISIGPAICEKCFEVGSEVIEAAIELLGYDCSELYIQKENNKYLLNLRGVVKKRFTQLGIPENNIEIIKDCTMHSPEKYWSHRYTKGERGSQANIIMLN